jgi:hypothetical protein
MQNLIADYLLENKQCFIPSLGLLSFKKTSASFNFGEQNMTAPKHSILFEEKELDNDNLAQYIASKKNISIADANNLIADFSASVNFLAENETTKISGLGEFKKIPNGKIEFIAATLNTAFAPTVQALKVVHPNATHSMTVGDTETDTESMKEFFEENTAVKDRWWLAAAIFATISIGVFLYFMLGTNHKSLGNVFPIEKIEAEKTFTLPK